MKPVVVAGAGSWGTALSVLLAGNGVTTYLWGHRREQVAELARDRCNQRYLPGVSFPHTLNPVPDLAGALAGTDDLLIAVPCAALRTVLDVVRDAPAGDRRVAWACKGFEYGTGLLVHEVVAEILGKRVPTAVISGPSFAREVAAGKPTAVTVASQDAVFAEELVARLHNPAFRAYTTDDVIGVEVGGAVKNVLAIAAGVSDGMALGANARAALVTRGLAEITRLGVALGGRAETFMGLAGLGDLVLTCTDDQSRNRRLGLALGRGQGLQAALDAIGQVVEGARTAHAVAALARRLGVEMPITEQVADLLAARCTPAQALQALMSREPKQEIR